MSSTVSNTEKSAAIGMRSIIIGLIVNLLLAFAKGIAGVLGHSSALIADAVESVSDIFSSLIVLLGLKMSKKPADENHPYGHGKIEPLAATLVSLILFGAAIFIAIHSFHQLSNSLLVPEPFTLIVLLIVILIKGALSRFIGNVGAEVSSVSVRADAAHHRADVMTSLAAFIGISVALVGGPGYEHADAVAALFASLVIAFNATILFKPALYELLDTAPSPDLIQSVRKTAEGVGGVLGTHKCHVRKLGFDHYVDLDILCNPELTIRAGHEIAHNVGEAIHAKLPNITKVLVHVEPVDDYGRRVRD
jgi:cation diffusion facilitator family transporter